MAEYMMSQVTFVSPGPKAMPYIEKAFKYPIAYIIKTSSVRRITV